MDGMLLVDKPSGWTSHDAVNFIRRSLGEKRVGHTGTLDPAATGLLIVLVGKASRLARYFEDDHKAYLATMSLGAETDTQDATGQVIRECPVPEIDAETLQRALGQFTGEITQTPPMYSALKSGGTPLYKLARKGVEVEVTPRRVTISSLRLVSFAGADIGFETVCSKGTYVRTLCRDIAEALGTCGRLETLRRTAVGAYRIEDALDISHKPGSDEIAGHVTPLSDMLPWLPSAVLSGDAARGVANGISPLPDGLLSFPYDTPAGGAVRVTGEDGDLLAMALATGIADAPLKLQVVLI